MIEISGARSSGRTALAYRVVLETTRRGGLAGWVDPANQLDPSSLRRAGVGLERVLWVRPREAARAFRAVELLLKSGFRAVVLDLCDVDPRSVARLGTAVWSRLWRAVRGGGGTTVVLTSASGASGDEASVFGSVSSLGLRTVRQVSVFDRGLFEGYRMAARVVRDRAGPAGREQVFHVFHRDESALAPPAHR